MRTITADWSVPHGKSGSWLSGMGTKLQRTVSSWTADRRNARNTARPSDHKSQEPFVQADAAAFISAFMRIG
jgi:hypothetical protein